MKLFTFSVRVLVGIAVVSLTACYKDVEILPDKKNKKDKDCQISKIRFNDPSGAYDGIFYYNRKGDPDSVIFDLVGTGFPNIFFVYDKKDLTEVKQVYSNGTYELWHRYGYTHKVITTDTVYAFGNSDAEPEPANFLSKRINYIEYDNKGRIVRETEDYIVPDLDPVIRTYTYDENGNLQTPGVDLVYDEQDNLHSVHFFWQFLARDFSENNPIEAVVYNESGLPLLFDTPPSEFSRFRFVNGGRSLEKSIIKYDCRKGKDIFY